MRYICLLLIGLLAVYANPVVLTGSNGTINFVKTDARELRTTWIIEPKLSDSFVIAIRFLRNASYGQPVSAPLINIYEGTTRDGPYFQFSDQLAPNPNWGALSPYFASSASALRVEWESTTENAHLRLEYITGYGPGNITVNNSGNITIPIIRTLSESRDNWISLVSPEDQPQNYFLRIGDVSASGDFRSTVIYHDGPSSLSPPIPQMTEPGCPYPYSNPPVCKYLPMLSSTSQLTMRVTFKQAFEYSRPYECPDFVSHGTSFACVHTAALSISVDQIPCANDICVANTVVTPKEFITNGADQRLVFDYATIYFVRTDTQSSVNVTRDPITGIVLVRDDLRNKADYLEVLQKYDTKGYPGQLIARTYLLPQLKFELVFKY